jgi:hypothetical protein
MPSTERLLHVRVEVECTAAFLEALRHALGRESDSGTAGGQYESCGWCLQIAVRCRA